MKNLDLEEATESLRRMRQKMLASPRLRWDDSKIDQWFVTRNPAFGNLQPIHMVNSGRFEFLEAWIERALELPSPTRRIDLPPRA